MNTATSNATTTQLQMFAPMADIVKQSNTVTFARYDYTVWEKRIIYKLFEILQRTQIDDYTKSLPIYFPLYELANNKDNYRHIKESLKTLRDKTFEIEDKSTWAYFGFINDAKIDEATQQVYVEVNRNIVGHLKGLLEKYTTYNLMIAYTLKSSYSQRFYEFCHSYKDRGGFFFMEKKLRKLLKLEDKYAMFAAFKNRVIEVAKTELRQLYDKGLCDICFDYSIEKLRTKEIKISFVVFSKEEKILPHIPAEATTLERDLFFFIELIWPENLVRQNRVFEIIKNSGRVQEALNKINEMYKRTGKPYDQIAGLIVKTLREDISIKI